jgi:hypothetical protein
VGAEAPGEGGRVVLACAAQETLVRRLVARILPGRRYARGPVLVVVVPRGLEALDAGLVDVPVLALEGVRVDDEVVDQVVDVGAESGQRVGLAFADRLAPRNLAAHGLLGIQVRVAAEAVQVGGVRRAEPGSD